MTITLRPIEPSDEAALAKLYASTREEEVAAWGWSAAQREAFLHMQYRAWWVHHQANAPSALWQVILDDDQAIGWIIVVREATSWLLADIALLPPWRGQGIGTALLRRLLADAAAEGVPVRLHVAKDNPAQRLYLRLGFVPRADMGIHLRMEAFPREPVVTETTTS